jgi:hypothetical protein
MNSITISNYVAVQNAMQCYCEQKWLPGRSFLHTASESRCSRAILGDEDCKFFNTRSHVTRMQGPGGGVGRYEHLY